MNEDKEALIMGYWVKFAKILSRLSKLTDPDAKIYKAMLLEATDILDKIIELEKELEEE